VEVGPPKAFNIQYREPKQWIRYAKMAVRCKQRQAAVSVPMTDMKNISVLVEETAKDRFFCRRHNTDVQLLRGNKV
jgi:hypothetical protein